MKKIQHIISLFSLATLCTCSTLYAQVKIGLNPTNITSTSNLEVEGAPGGNANKMVVTKDESKVGIGTVTPTNKLHVISPVDPLKLEGVVPGTGNEIPLTIDANGVVKKRPATVPAPTVRLTARISAAYDATGLYKYVPFDILTSNDGNFSIATSHYTVPSTGTYMFAAMLEGNVIQNSPGIGPVSLEWVLRINNTIEVNLNNFAGNLPSGTVVHYTKPGNATLWLNAGDKVALATYTCQGCSNDYYNIQPQYTQLTIIKLD